MLHLVLKWLHVLFAIAAVGTNLTYGVWIAGATRDGAALPFALRGIRILDDRLANPSYGLLLVSGLAMIYVGGWSLTTPWILPGLGLYVILVLVGLLGYRPTLPEQIRLAVLAVAIVFLMVAKPGLWTSSPSG